MNDTISREVIDDITGKMFVEFAFGYHDSVPYCDVNRFGIPYLICSKKATCVMVEPDMVPVPLCKHHELVGLAHSTRWSAILPLWQFVRERGVSLVRSWGPGEQRHDGFYDMPEYKARSAPYPQSVKYRVMLTKAWAIANGYYVAKNEMMKHVLGHDAFWSIGSQRLARIEVPTYELMRQMLLNGDFADDGDVEGGDYILACRVALQVTAERYKPIVDRAPF